MDTHNRTRGGALHTGAAAPQPHIDAISLGRDLDDLVACSRHIVRRLGGLLATIPRTDSTQQAAIVRGIALLEPLAYGADIPHLIQSHLEAKA